MKSTTKKVAKLIRQAVNQVDDMAEVILFGSRARGDEHQGSDWDILVLTDDPVDLEKEMKFREQPLTPICTLLTPICNRCCIITRL